MARRRNCRQLAPAASSPGGRSSFPWTIFVLLSLGYFCLACLRKAVTIAIPTMMATLDISKADFGLITSSFAVAFGLSKFLGSIASDYLSPKYLLCCSLLISSLGTLLFSSTTSTLIFATFWAIHGLGQGSGWPPISQMIYTYFEPGKRGTVWSVITSIGNVGYLVAPVVFVKYVNNFGWQFPFISLGLVGVFTVLVLLLFLPKPLQPVDPKMMGPSPLTETSSLLHGKVLCLSLANCLTALLLSAVTDWAGLYLSEFYHLPTETIVKILFFGELGGLVAALICGIAADTYFQRKLDLFCFLFSMFLPISVFSFPRTSMSADMTLYFSLVMFFIVAAINGPKTLIGIAVREIVPAESAGMVSGVVGVCGQIGSTLAGSGLAHVLQNYGWEYYPLVLYISSFAAMTFYAISFLLCPFPPQRKKTI